MIGCRSSVSIVRSGVVAVTIELLCSGSESEDAKSLLFVSVRRKLRERRRMRALAISRGNDVVN